MVLALAERLAADKASVHPPNSPSARSWIEFENSGLSRQFNPAQFLQRYPSCFKAGTARRIEIFNDAHVSDGVYEFRDIIGTLASCHNKSAFCAHPLIRRVSPRPFRDNSQFTPLHRARL